MIKSTKSDGRNNMDSDKVNETDNNRTDGNSLMSLGEEMEIKIDDTISYSGEVNLNLRVKRGLGACIKRCLKKMIKSHRNLYFRRCRLMCH